MELAKYIFVIYYVLNAVSAECERPICPKLGSILLEDPWNAAGYISCKNGVPTPKFCREGEYFFLDNQSCGPSYSYIAPKCQAAPSLPNKCNTATKTRFRCPRQGLYPHPGDSHLFYQCDGNKNAYCKECPSDLVFDPTSKVCNYGTPDYQIDQQISLPFPETHATQCYERPDGKTVLLPNLSDCTKYFICNHGRPVAMNCPTTLVFNPAIDACDYSTNTNCRRKY